MLFFSLNDLTHQLILGHVKTNALITSKYPTKYFEVYYSIININIPKFNLFFMQ